MGEWFPVEIMWRNALAVIPLAVAVALICRLLPARPSTRHALWLVVLGLLVAAPLLPAPRIPAIKQVVPDIQRTVPDVERPAPKTESTSSVVGAPRALPSPSPSPGMSPARPVRRDPPKLDRPSPQPAVALPPTIFSGFQHRPLRSPTPETAPGVSPGPATPEPDPARARPSAGESIGIPADRTPVAPWRALPEGEASWSSDWKAWTSQLAAIRDAVMGLPPIPLTLWMGGLAVLLIVGAGRVSRSSRLVRAARPAPPSVRRVVAEAAERMGLRRPPITLMVDQRISPMLWCGRPPRLLLPQGLWSQLDPVGRSAVVVHELAHLRRRDHWVCWAEMIVSLLYWWHPVVWWIRRRLREEADLACDIWVTALHPAGRRAYAEALLETRRYHISSKHNAVPSVGLGASTARAKRFARRLTMVMTAQISPRFSLRGAALVSAVGLAAYLASPLWACPPEDKDPCKVKEVQKKSKGSTKHRLLVPPAPPAPAAPATAPRAPEDGPTTFERFMRQRGDREGMSLEERIRELEREIEQLYQELQRLQGVPRAAFAVPPELAVLSGVFGAPEEEAPVKAGGNCLGSAAVTDGQTVVRVYQLPEGKLAALTELMVRDDVPIRVRPMDDAIEVHASPAQQCIFELFCKLVNGDDRVTGHALPSGKLDAITELMVRSDVPILVEPGEKQIRVHGTDVEQAVFDAFCTLIHPGGVAYAESAASAYGIAGSYAESYDDRARQYGGARSAARGRARPRRGTAFQGGGDAAEGAPVRAASRIRGAAGRNPPGAGRADRRPARGTRGRDRGDRRGRGGRLRRGRGRGGRGLAFLRCWRSRRAVPGLPETYVYRSAESVWGDPVPGDIVAGW
jgi:beta-lactamase regulating signal transducer with metallopeptidase domain